MVKGWNIEYIRSSLWFMDWSAQVVSVFRTSKKADSPPLIFILEKVLAFR